MTSPSRLLHLDGREQTWAELEARNAAYWAEHDEWGVKPYQANPIPQSRTELIRMALQQRYPAGVAPLGTWSALAREFGVTAGWVSRVASATGWRVVHDAQSA